MTRSPWKNDDTSSLLHRPSGSAVVTRAAMAVPTTAVPMLVPTSCAVSFRAVPIDVLFSGMALTRATAQMVMMVRRPRVRVTMKIAIAR